MADLNKAELRRLANEATETEMEWPDATVFGRLITEDWADYAAAASPAAILALLDELEDAQHGMKHSHAIRLKKTIEDLEGERGQLRSEVAQLRDRDQRVEYWKQRAKSAEGHLWSSDAKAAASALHRYSRYEGTPWNELTGQQQALIQSAACSVIAEVNARRDSRCPHDARSDTVWCACGDGYPVTSYGAGFMVANNGVCENCDAESSAKEDGANG